MKNSIEITIVPQRTKINHCHNLRNTAKIIALSGKTLWKTLSYLEKFDNLNKNYHQHFVKLDKIIIILRKVGINFLAINLERKNEKFCKMLPHVLLVRISFFTNFIYISPIEIGHFTVVKRVKLSDWHLNKLFKNEKISIIFFIGKKFKMLSNWRNAYKICKKKTKHTASHTNWTCIASK